MKTKRSYGTFILGNAEFAIDAAAINEVVNYPKEISKMPLAPSFVIGVFQLRGQVIPILSITTLLNIKSEASSGNGRIVIVNSNGIQVGLIFDLTKEIIHLGANSAQQACKYTENFTSTAVKGVLHLEEEKRLVQVLDLERMIKIANLPLLEIKEMRRLTNKDTTSSALSPRFQCISFYSGDLLLGLDIEGVSEIISMPELQVSALQRELCLGFSHLRNRTLPIINFEHLLGKKIQYTKNKLKEKRVVVLRIGNEHIGLAIDAVQGISRHTRDEIKAVPLFSGDRNEFLRGCIPQDNEENLLLLDHEKILSNQELNEIGRGHGLIYSEKSPIKTSLGSKNISSVFRERYITFQLGYEAAFKMSEIQEIIPFPEALTEAPSAPEWVHGLFSLRGNLISLVNLRKIYDMEENLDVKNSHVLILKFKSDTYGLVVDSVSSTLSVDPKKSLKLPSPLHPNTGAHMKNDLKEVIDPTGDISMGKAIVIFNIEAIFDRINKSLAA